MLHKNALAGDIHILPNWVVADATALSALVPVLADEGKMAWQTDNDSFHILIDYAGPTWKLLNTVPFSGDAADISVADVGTYYTGTDAEAVLQEVGAALVAASGAITDLQTQVKQTLGVALGDETTALTTGTSKVAFHWPIDADILDVWIGLRTAQASGATLPTFDVNVAGSSVLSTKITIDNTEKTSLTAATPRVISDTTWDKGQEVTVDIDAIQSGSVAAGAKLFVEYKVRV